MKSPPKNRIFLELANNEITYEWLANAYEEMGWSPQPTPAAFEQMSKPILVVKKQIEEALSILIQGIPLTRHFAPLLYAFQQDRIYYLSKDKNKRVTYGQNLNMIEGELRKWVKLPDYRPTRISGLVIEGPRSFWEFLETGLTHHLRQCVICDKYLIHPTRKRCVKCGIEYERKAERLRKAAKRYENFVNDVKKSCPTFRDYLRNNKLVARGKRFKRDYGEVLNHLIKILPQ